MNADNGTLVVVPTNTEVQQLLGGLSETGATARASTHGRLSTFEVDALGIVVAPGGLGKTQFAVQTQHLLSIASWRSVICAGAAGALSDDVSNGDVVIGAETVEHDIRKVSRAMLPRFPADSALLDGCRTAATSCPEVRVHFGAIASGDEDIVRALISRASRAKTSTATPG